jgi:hypothetical protein
MEEQFDFAMNMGEVSVEMTRVPEVDIWERLEVELDFHPK